MEEKVGEIPMTRNRPKSKGFIRSHSESPCPYCRLFDFEGSSFGICLGCGREVKG